jgi:recombination protein RecR
MLPTSVKQLVQSLSRLPGIGEKTALRLALYLVLERPALLESLALALKSAGEQVSRCEQCGNLAELGEGPSRCAICRDPRRDSRVLCVVARIQDLLALERSAAMQGRYFVLGKLLSPLDGVAADDLPIAALRERIVEGCVEELVIATPPSVEGEATALHLGRELGSTVRVTRIASGIPHGGDLEFADAITLGRALAGRRQL